MLSKLISFHYAYCFNLTFVIKKHNKLKDDPVVKMIKYYFVLKLKKIFFALNVWDFINTFQSFLNYIKLLSFEKSINLKFNFGRSMENVFEF